METAAVRLAVIRDQIQLRSAIEAGIGSDQMVIFQTNGAAAKALRAGDLDAYANVGRAHAGFIAQNPDWGLGWVTVPRAEKAPAFGSFAFSLQDTGLLRDVDKVLASFLGSAAHRDMVAPFGVSAADVD